MDNEYCIELVNGKGQRLEIIKSDFGSDEDMVKTLLEALKIARKKGYCRLVLDVALLLK